MPSKFPARILKLSANALDAIDAHNSARIDEADSPEEQEQVTNALKSHIAQAIRTAYTLGLHTKTTEVRVK